MWKKFALLLEWTITGFISQVALGDIFLYLFLPEW